MIVEYIYALITFFTVNAVIWWFLEVRLWHLRAFDYRPFTCRKCLTLWFLLAVAVGAAMLGYFTYAVTLAIFAALNAVAQHIDDRERYG